MTTLFIADLHLEDKRPQLTRILCDFLGDQARRADALYILGDLFEFWIGDDVLSETAREVASAIRQLSDAGVPCYFIHGNRDFLLGQDYAAKAGLQLLPEVCVTDLYGTPTLLLHGDTLCTDDVDYQAFRTQVRNPQFQAMFLNMTPEQRLEMAANARDASKQQSSGKPMDIMDVNATAVRALFEQHSVDQMIHGHTHRPAVHQHVLDDGTEAQRVVLADWRDSGSYLQVTAQGMQTIPLPA